ncbi:bis(5'-nucleosyl)-tetraphosphatase (symmetrical) YqeK [Clostridium tagluense]|uniref:bis(5'-nucleosyl)-tetraphosphatase (symmetrical) YqeK n=1 Tax=Clostridium TaxID=1485 RepID=UPI0013E99AEA|nr:MULTISPECIES: bis(5'-nucleosyl)-tetraphosphatase (symmetrical) YqeK [Clostridium]MBU3128415.1 bis(5'-nucleosyl)-tetraphosphatase (symmetrical) YqeK [Clostridium tagluense]MBW9155079.1 bis(5'-nucleosyl)-tetraphosphatase (symmetrical) YqeK [Clostridium tagluense]MBZ9624691.1 bis(5'-nucleosyl)-tetraphosphatase (symmetrical) YqeK [Clostridium sp. FP2]MCB2313189.1 bis(5'-nucleosyl)-tetraphosphatase (symmetrical) YqeK [Clostridium tagluense]MCB2317955.1 bis(5'-nucleosyl)-tetraphosphatase (symmetr
MWNEKEMLHYLHTNLSESRLKHSLSVSETAVTLAAKYGENIESARIAGLVHDCAKNVKGAELIKIASEHEIHIDEIYTNNPAILHGLVGSIIAREIMGIQNEKILSAIRYHTTGRKNMSILEKIIYISDYIEPLRKFKGVEELRTLSLMNLDAAVMQSLENTIIYVISQKELLHIDTIHARNYLLSKNRR